MPAKSSFKWPEKLRIIPWWGTQVDTARSWGKLLEEDTGMKVVVGAETNTVNRFRWLGRVGLSDVTQAAPAETSHMVRGDRKYGVRDGGPFQVRILWQGTKASACFFTRGDSRIKTPYDIKPGTRITDILPFVAATRVYDGLLAWGRVKKEDIEWVKVYDNKENIMAVVEGRADICFNFPTTNVTREAAKNPYGLSIVECNSEADPEGAKRFREWDPLINFYPVPEGVLEGASGKWSMGGLSLELTNERLDPQLVYHLAKWLDENWSRYKDRHQHNKFKTRELLMKNLGETYVPCHEGLIMYLKDLGLWTAKHERRHKKNLDLLTRYCD
ncbi:MAG: hypothetical protein C4555_00695, partial [Dehalococcoidia bacterium]